MASQGSKGLSKRHSPLQKDHYKSHPHRLERNKKRRMRTYILRNVRAAVRKHHGIDEQAIREYKKKYGDDLATEIKHIQRTTKRRDINGTVQPSG